MCPALCWMPTAKGVLSLSKNASSRRKGNTFWAMILSWLSSLLLTLLALCLVLLTTVCSASYMNQQVARSDFSEAA